MHPVDFNIDQYIESGALGFRIDLNKPTELVQLELTMHETDAKTFYESQLSKDQKIQHLDHQLVLIQATVPLTSQLIWWLRSFGKKSGILNPLKSQLMLMR
jgi:hypothetical protein